MSEPLRPLNLFEILDRTALLYRSRFLVFIGISLIPATVFLVPGTVFFLLFSGSMSAAPGHSGRTLLFLSIFVFFLAALPVYLGATALGAAATNHASALACLDERTTIRDAYKTVWRIKWRYLWLYVLQLLLVWVAPFAVWVGLLASRNYIARAAVNAGMDGKAFNAAFGLTEVLVAVTLIVYALWMAIRLSLAFPASLVEKINLRAALKRSSALCSGTHGRILLVFLLGIALNIFLWYGILTTTYFFMFQFRWFKDSQHSNAAGTIAVFVLYALPFVLQTAFRPVYGIALTLFYYDQRIRLEGYDIERMMETAGMDKPSIPLIAEEPAAPQSPQETHP